MEAIIFILAYMFPTIVAMLRGHHNRWAILIFNLVLGLTVVGWLIALTWSATAVRREGGAA